MQLNHGHYADELGCKLLVRRGSLKGIYYQNWRMIDVVHVEIVGSLDHVEAMILLHLIEQCLQTSIVTTTFLSDPKILRLLLDGSLQCLPHVLD